MNLILLRLCLGAALRNSTSLPPAQQFMQAAATLKKHGKLELCVKPFNILSQAQDIPVCLGLSSLSSLGVCVQSLMGACYPAIDTDCSISIRSGAEPGQGCHMRSGNGSVDHRLVRSQNHHLRPSVMLSLGLVMHLQIHLFSDSSASQAWNTLIFSKASGITSPSWMLTMAGP